MQLERWDDAVSAYEEAIRIKPDEATAPIWRALGRAFYESRRYQEAIDAFVKASSLASDGGRDNIWIARCMIELAQWIQAESALLGQLRREPSDAATLELLAFVYNQQNNWPGIIGIYRQLLAIAPQRTAYRIALARALTVQGQKQQAIDMLEFARRVDVGSGEQIDRLLADLYLAEEMPQEAAGCYARLIRMLDHPSAEDYYRLALAYFQTGDLTSAEDAFRNMQQVVPTDFKADLYLGHVAAQAGRPDEAQTHYSAAVAKNPASVEGLVALADLQIKSKHHAQAAANLAKAIARGDNRPQVHYNYILALMNVKDEAGVRAALKVALAEHPADERLNRLLSQHVEQTVSE
jgi:tetratricopeptide (TPR) repeat protein